MAKLATKTYSEALFELAVEENIVDDLYNEVIAVKDALKENPELSQLMVHPKVSRDEKIKLIEDIFKGKVSDVLCGFLVRIVAADRYNMLDETLDCFVALIKEYKKIGIAYVVTPFELESDKKQLVEQKLLDTTKYETMEMHYSVDPSLIGGMRIRIGDKVVDSSVSTKLMQLSRDLHKIQLKNI